MGADTEGGERVKSEKDTNGEPCSRLLAWAQKRKGCVIGGRELLRQMEKCGCMGCDATEKGDTESDDEQMS